MEERIVVADPVADPMGYQREMVALLGGRDPAEVLGGTVAALRGLADGVPEEVLGRRPEPREWSVAEVLGHIWDSEVALSWRSRRRTPSRPPAGYSRTNTGIGRSVRCW
jgi:hypothetical protein